MQFLKPNLNLRTKRLKGISFEVEVGKYFHFAITSCCCCYGIQYGGTLSP